MPLADTMGHENEENLGFKYILSATAASVAEIATYPLDLTKTRLQIQGERNATFVQKEVNSGVKVLKHRGMFKTAIGIAQEEGILRLWQGITPAIYRHFVYSGCRMTFYEMIREHVLKRNSDGTIALWKATLGGMAAGSLGQFLASPTDLVKVQMQMEGRRRLEGLSPRVRSTWHAFTKILAEGGIRGLWKGWVPNVQRAALVNLGDLTTYDTSKHLLIKHTGMKDNLITHSVASAMSGFVAATLGTPADVVKSRVMNQPTDSKGRGLLYKSSVDCLMKTVNLEGFVALYKGFLPIWIRLGPWSLTFWITYEQLRKFCGVAPF